MTLIALMDLRLRPGSGPEALAVLHETLAATRAFEGCLGVDVLVDTDDPAHVVVHERWDSPRSDAAYREWRSSPEGASQLPSVLAAEPVLTRLTVATDV
ncbi:hypothetical protein NUM3379_28230 [Kineococcus sp. NUM-3379]